MARWTKNHMLELGAVLLLLGLVGSIIAFTYRFADATPSWLAWYGDIVLVASGDFAGDYNLLTMIAGPILLIWGGFWVGEQVVLRRRFERLLDTPKRSEFAARRTEVEDMLKRLPDGYKARVKQKEGEFVSRRA